MSNWRYRTNTCKVNRFSRPLPEAVVYDLSTPLKASITLPPGSTWTSGPHWHDAHTEFLRVERGAAQIVLAGQILTSVTRSDGVVTVPRGTIHEWCRSKTEELDVDLRVTEWTEPGDGQKEVFFRNVNGMVLDTLRWCDEDPSQKQDWFRDLDINLKLLFRDMDNLPVVLSGRWPMLVHRFATHLVLFWNLIFYVLIWDILGWHSSGRPRSVYDEYTPPRLR